ncbi:cryptochrome/photolyase family protein [Amycolatopsis sp. H20-H5]|uniref:cryptochrome/photolyase family protein n=1 Tax=Amycolatopsis sp. H20-H5 TaxID=3046309 RepID=UPI002DBD1933|nr:deoxyribodipyrimidine photo-lyase [Amycolatopsis sp. H20-H5]MEC3979595.1 deoxyribodipyrimidine photo-lyase [Amycolatopsis sp. H20-H5]
MTKEAPVVLWFRRDLRLGDHAALLAASKRSKHVLALYVLDDALLAPAGNPRIAFLHGCLRALDEQLGGRLKLVKGEPAEEVVKAARAVGAAAVYVTADTGPYGRRRDGEVAKVLAEHDIAWEEAGSPYAITPGRITKPDGDPYRVFTPFFRAWTRHGWPRPADTGASIVDWVEPGKSLKIPKSPSLGEMELPEPGEQAALDVWREFHESAVAGYSAGRDRPDKPATTKISPYLRWGCIHPRTLLADLAGDESEGAAALRGEFAWREFHADVLWNRPETARQNYDERFDAMQHETGAAARAAFGQWCEGRTGYPIVDAGMRQLLAEGWMHNRVRMVVASFLVKDLHIPWWWGARHFMQYLVDGDLASNQLNWQWVAGSGTDAAPYFRVFNPTTQGEKFDPNGDYVRKYVPELREVPGKAVHQPWKLNAGQPEGYPEPMVDHAHERQVALRRYEDIKGQ